MRRLLSLFFAVALLVTACSKPEPDNPTPDTPKQETVTLSPGTNTAPVIATAGGSTNVSFTASASWSASIINTKADSWCSVAPTSGVAGAATITITVKENATPDNRSASVVIKVGTSTQTIKVEQKQKDALTVTASSFEVPADGGQIKVATKSNVSFTHTISTDAQSWIKAVETKALKDSTLTFEIDVNKEVEKRSGQIYLTSGDLKDTVNVYQAGETPTIVVGQNEYVLKSEGESFEIEVASNVNATMNMVYPQGVEAWIVENTSKSISTNKFYFTAKANEGYDSRSAMIVFSNAENNLADTVTVTQAQKDAIVVAKSSYNVENAGGTIEIEVGHNVDYECTISADWITKAETKAMETDKLVFTVAENTSYDNREGLITFTANGGALKQEVKVYQSEKGALIISKKDHVIGNEGGEITLEIQANVEFSVSDPSVDWLHNTTTKGLQTHTLKYTVDAYEGYESRTTQLFVTNTKTGTQETLTITQTQKDAIVVAKSSYEVGKAGGRIEIEVGHNIDYTYSITTDWITVMDTKAMTTDKLVFTVAENPNDGNREGSIVFIAKEGSITQEVKIYQYDDRDIIISKKDYLIPETSGAFSVQIQTKIEFSVGAPTVSWLRKESTKSMQTHTLWYVYDANDSYESRSTELYVTNLKTGEQDTLTVTQMQKGAIVIAKNEYEFGPEGGHLDLEIQTNLDITVSIPEECASWITQVETRGLETKKLFFDIAACSSPAEDRVGSIDITGGNSTQTIKIFQGTIKEKRAVEREALIAFYNATGGNNWSTNTNWCSDKPVSDWYGVSCNADGMVYSLMLDNNNLNGVIPEELQDLKALESLYLSNNNFTSGIPKELGNIKSLKVFTADNCGLTGSIPHEIGKLNNLEILSLYFNNLSGNIPIDLCNLVNLQTLSLNENKLTGSLPKELGGLTELIYLGLGNNMLEGEIPAEIGLLTRLEKLSFGRNKLTGKIPSELKNLKNLKQLDLRSNQLSGSIPKELGILTLLNYLDLSHNNFTGSIPEELGNLVNIEPNDCFAFNLSNNNLTGKVPLSITNLPNWNMGGWMSVLMQNGDGLDKDGIIIKMPKFSTITLDGEIVTDDYFRQNEYTVIMEFIPYNATAAIYIPKLIQLYKQYKSDGLAIVSLTASHLESDHKKEIDNYNIPWPFIYDDTKGCGNVFRPYNMMACEITIFNRDGELIFCDYALNSSCDDDPIKVITDKFGPIGEIEMYESIDFSADGSVTALQTATVGDGIDIVLMGDGYSDRLIADGTYNNAMNAMYEKFFSVEPYKSFKEYFNVYSVTVVSKNEVYNQNSSTALSCYFGGTTLVGGDDGKVFEYAQKAIGPERLDNAVVITAMNSKAYAGTCYLYYPVDGDYGNGVTVSYFPMGADDDALERVIHHEAGGHGFAKLADEYDNGAEDIMPESAIQSNKALEVWGWIKNVDFTADPQQVKWAKFLADTRYQNDGLGVFEGAFGYKNGAWRPSQNSIMKDNTGGFNAPSREAIYYRIHKLAYGADWQYDYEKFVEWDAINRKKEAQTKSMPLVLDPEKSKLPHTPPVVIPHSWREAK